MDWTNQSWHPTEDLFESVIVYLNRTFTHTQGERHCRPEFYSHEWHKFACSPELIISTLVLISLDAESFAQEMFCGLLEISSSRIFTLLLVWTHRCFSDDSITMQFFLFCLHSSSLFQECLETFKFLSFMKARIHVELRYWLDLINQLLLLLLIIIIMMIIIITTIIENVYKKPNHSSAMEPWHSWWVSKDLAI